MGPTCPCERDRIGAGEGRSPEANCLAVFPALVAVPVELVAVPEHAEAVALARLHAGHVAVPNVAGGLRQVDPGLRTVRIEHARSFTTAQRDAARGVRARTVAGFDLEARVDAAVLLGVVDPKASQKSIENLTESYTR